MDKFIHSENVKLYRKALDETTDDSKRQMLLDLIRDELAKTPKPKN